MSFVELETERAMVARLKAGDPAAFEAVYELYRPRLYGFLVRLSRQRDVAEDLLEETWLRLVEHVTRLADDTCLAAWLFTVARNLYTSWCRHRAVEDDRIFDVVPTWPSPMPGETPFEATARNEMQRRIEIALAKLSVADREALLLVSVEGLSPADAASIVGLSAEAMRKRLQRARERLAGEMNKSAPSTRWSENADGHQQPDRRHRP